MGLIVKLYNAGPTGPEFRLFEIDRDAPFDLLLRRIAARISGKSPVSQNTDEETDLQSVKDGICICDTFGDWITVTCQDEWELYLKGYVPQIPPEDEQESFILNIQTRPASGYPQALHRTTTIRRIGSALRSIFLSPMASKPANNVKATQDETASINTDEASVIQHSSPEPEQPVLSKMLLDDLPEESQDDSTFEIINNRVEPEEEEEKDEEEEEEEKDDDDDSDQQEDDSDEEEEEDESEKEDEAEEPVEEESPVPPPAPEVVVPPEFQECWDVLVQMGFTDNERMLQLLTKYKGKNLARIVDQLLRE